MNDRLSETSTSAIRTGEALQVLASQGHVDFAGLELPGESLLGIELRGVDLCNSKLSGANLTGTDLRGAELRDADLSGVNLSGTDLSDADLSGADLTNANLTNANLTDALLPCANLEGAECFGTLFIGADMHETVLAKTNLNGAVLTGSNLGDANLRGACLRWANLRAASLRGADLRGANMQETNLADANLTDVRFNRSTRFRGIDVTGSRGNPVFKRFALDQDYLEAFRSGHPVVYWIWFLVSDCGRSMALWTAWAACVAIVFASIYWFFPEHIAIPGGGLNGRVATPMTYLYYSVSTFTTLGFGDILPRTWIGELLAIAEVTIGYLMLGGIVSILANKLARRA